ncbi:expressed unknown protein [Seminavis robusta]|uniref:RRM domain-containing protein n=1 Tax=Seminavis robusta TaxID=568900 RepID=A0A9N8DJT4_9STRA|nr:expressed unknown protein [Seminavis robusta]|eukprot:Sro122_g059250.1 n/a (1076) ;mRNA; r:62213-65665
MRKTLIKWSAPLLLVLVVLSSQLAQVSAQQSTLGEAQLNGGDLAADVDVWTSVLNASSLGTLSRSSQRFTLFYTLDGPTGDGAFRDVPALQQLIWFMRNLTMEFAPTFATLEEVENVTTNCLYRTQKNFDEPTDLPPAMPGAIYEGELLGRRRNPYLTRQSAGIVDSLIDLAPGSLFGNTTYGVVYDMNYSSFWVDVENYTYFYEDTIYQKFDQLTLGLRLWLEVPDDSVLVVKGVYRTVTEAQPANVSAATLNTIDQVEDVVDEADLIKDTLTNTTGSDSSNAALNETDSYITDAIDEIQDALIDLSRNYTTTMSIAPSTSPSAISIQPSAMPTSTTVPSDAPSTSLQPTISMAPSMRPSESPTRTPSDAPSVSPSMFPTFETNSTERQKYIFTFTMENVSNPSHLFRDTALMCEFFIGLTPEIVEEGQNADYVMTTCPQVASLGFSFPTQTRVPFTTPPGSPPVLAPTLEPTGRVVYDDDTTESKYNETLEANQEDQAAYLEENNITRTRLRGRRELQFEANGTAIENAIDEANEDGEYPAVKYTFSIVMRWESAVYEVTSYSNLLHFYVNSNPVEVGEDLYVFFNLTEDDGTNLTVNKLQVVFDSTTPPSSEPSASPSEKPSYNYLSDEPTFSPTPAPVSTVPPGNGTDPLPPEGSPTSTPGNTKSPSTEATLVPSTPRSDTTIIAIVVVIVVIFSSGLMVFLFYFYQTRRQRMRELIKQRRPSQGAAAAGATAMDYQNPGGSSYQMPAHSPSTTANSVSPTVGTDAALVGQSSGPPSNILSEGGSSRRSGPDDDLLHSDLTNGSSMGAKDGDSQKLESALDKDNSKKHMMGSLLSDIEEDPYYSTDDNDDEPTTDDNTTQSPLDEFERYKDRNLEKMRSNVEDNVTGLDDMMSQAMTMALIMDEGASGSAPYWHGAKTGVEIEANALWEVTEWMKRKGESAEDDEKNIYMQGLLNKMVTSVRKGIVDPEDASRTIHECAFLLGLKLANQLPVTTIVLSGMHKATTTADIIRVLKKFGNIESAAVASNQRGFGIVRFKNQKSSMAAMEQHDTDEVVVKNVGVTMKLLSPLNS